MVTIEVRCGMDEGMYLAIVWKELREARGFAAFALASYFIYLCRLTGHWNRLLNYVLGWFPLLHEGPPPDVPLLGDGFGPAYGLVAATLAIGMGIRQSAWEASQGTATYLLHCPMSRRSIVLCKLATGIGVQLGCTVAPILAYAAWAAAPGTHAGPFEWSMTLPMLRVCLVMPLLYLGAFATGLRPAHWFGSRLLPLVSAVIAAVLVHYALQWRFVGLLALLLSATVLTSNILMESETRDF